MFKENIGDVIILSTTSSILKHLYLNDYAEYSKISYIMFLHDYLFACRISTVRTLALTKCKIIKNV